MGEVSRLLMPHPEGDQWKHFDLSCFLSFLINLCFSGSYGNYAYNGTMSVVHYVIYNENHLLLFGIDGGSVVVVSSLFYQG